jgi:pyruvate ferredoxin oxidoreductase delta subunit
MPKQKQQKNKIELTIGAIVKEPGSTLKNKTGSWRSVKPIVDRKRCIKCGRCWQFCPDSAIIMDKEGKSTVNYDYCKGCGICAEECPVKCIAMVKEIK